MARPVQIKVCGLTREEDVDLALSLGADFCGFILYSKSPRGLTLARAQELSARVPAEKRVVVDVEPSPSTVEGYRAAGFGSFQIHHHLEDFNTIATWSKLVGKEHLWLAPRLAPADEFPEILLDYADTLLVDTFAKNQVGGTGKVGDWARFNHLKATYPQAHWILAGGLSPDNVKEALHATITTHLDINSGVESQPGIKDPEKLRAVFRDLRG